MTEQIGPDDLATRLAAFAAEGPRRFVAIAGAPGSGKSTLAEGLLARIEAAQPGRAAILPMDGFHFDDTLLEPLGLLPRKGAPETFDTGGLRATLARLAQGTEPVAVPVFDRSIEIARAGARIIGPETRLILVEGNYLLLDRPGWTAIRALCDLTVLLDTPLETLRARLAERWRHLGPEAAARKVEENDLPNAELVVAESVAPDLRLGEAPFAAGG